MNKVVVTIFATFVGFAASANAQLIGYESFQNPTLGATTATGYADDLPYGTSLNGGNGGNGVPVTAGGTGFRNGVSYPAGASIVSGLTYAGLSTSNNAYQASTGNNWSATGTNPYRFQNDYLAYRVGGANNASFGINATGTAYDLYVSFLFNASDVTKTQRIQLNASAPSGIMMGLNGTNGQFTAAANGLGPAVFSNPSPTTLINNTTYLVVGKYSFTQTSAYLQKKAI